MLKKLLDIPINNMDLENAVVTNIDVSKPHKSMFDGNSYKFDERRLQEKSIEF